MDPAAQLHLDCAPNAMMHRLQPPSDRTLEVHGRYPHLDIRLHDIHIKVILATQLPQPRVLAIKFGEIYLREFAHGTSISLTGLMSEHKHI
jgi:hypothetical protein